MVPPIGPVVTVEDPVVVGVVEPESETVDEADEETELDTVELAEVVAVVLADDETVCEFVDVAVLVGDIVAEDDIDWLSVEDAVDVPVPVTVVETVPEWVVLAEEEAEDVIVELADVVADDVAVELGVVNRQLMKSP